MTVNPSYSTPPRPAPSLPFYEPVLDDFAAVNALIPRQLTSDVHLVEEIGQHLVEAGGKRLRPLVVLLAANACDAPAEARVKLAAVIEFLHTATLLHDDVVDSSGLRRGKLTANALWGNAPSVLVGDFVYSRAFQLMVELGQLDILSVLAEATNVIAEGEVMQLANIGRIDLSERDYRTIIGAKTAKLFEAAAHSAVLLNPAAHPARAERVTALKTYGRALGLAFQLVDDSLDYAGDAASLGKNAGDDLAEGKLTLPLIVALRDGDTATRALVQEALTRKDASALGEVRHALARCDALGYTQRAAENEVAQAKAALHALPESPFRSALANLADFALTRSF